MPPSEMSTINQLLMELQIKQFVLHLYVYIYCIYEFSIQVPTPTSWWCSG